MPGSNLNMLDLMKQTDPAGKMLPIVEALDKESPVLRTGVMKEGNLATGELFASRTALPSVHPRMFNQGIRASKAKVDQVTETCGMISGRATIDRKLADLNGNRDQARHNENIAFMESFGQEYDRSFFYASTKSDPTGQILGMTPRMDSLASKQVISAGTPGTLSNTSIWGVVWGENAVYSFYPRGGKGGLQPLDRGILDVNDENGDPVPSYVMDWDWQYGFAVKDKRKLVRVANINIANLDGNADTLIPKMISAAHRLHNPGSGRLVWYCNATVLEYLDLQARSAVKTGGQLSYREVDGQPKLYFRGSPIERSDALLDSEAAVS